MDYDKFKKLELRIPPYVGEDCYVYGYAGWDDPLTFEMILFKAIKIKNYDSQD